MLFQNTELIFLSKFDLEILNENPTKNKTLQNSGRAYYVMRSRSILKF